MYITHVFYLLNQEQLCCLLLVYLISCFKIWRAEETGETLQQSAVGDDLLQDSTLIFCSSAVSDRSCLSSPNDRNSRNWAPHCWGNAAIWQLIWGGGGAAVQGRVSLALSLSPAITAPYYISATVNNYKSLNTLMIPCVSQLLIILYWSSLSWYILVVPWNGAVFPSIPVRIH